MHKAFVAGLANQGTACCACQVVEGIRWGAAGLAGIPGHTLIATMVKVGAETARAGTAQNATPQAARKGNTPDEPGNCIDQSFLPIPFSSLDRAEGRR